MKTTIQTAIQTPNAEITAAAYAIAYPMARGTYQRSLLDGRAALSGADLKGRAKKYGAHYSTSRRNLLARIACVLTVAEHIGNHGKRVLVIR